MSFQFYPFYDGKLKPSSTDFTDKIMYKASCHGKPVGMWHDADMSASSSGSWPDGTRDTNNINYSVGDSVPGTKTIYAVRVGTGSDKFYLSANKNLGQWARFGPGFGEPFGLWYLNWYTGHKNEANCPYMTADYLSRAFQATDAPVRFYQTPNIGEYDPGFPIYNVWNVGLCRMRQARWVVTFYHGVYGPYVGGYNGISTWELAASGGELDSPVGTYTHWTSGWTSEVARPASDTIDTVSVEEVTV